MSSNNHNGSRFERKFVSSMMRARVEAIVRLHPAMFVRAFAQRCVNNVYFDTPDLNYYHDNVDGQTKRHKVRVRWYGPLLGPVHKAVLEFKSKNGLLGDKKQYPLMPFDFDDTFDQQRWHHLLRSSSLPTNICQHLCALRPTLANRYQRQYLHTTDRRFRLTIDSDLMFYPMQPTSRLARRSADRDHTIVELKYDPVWDAQAGQITQGFTFRLSRSSKYVLGLQSVWGYCATCPPAMTAPTAASVCKSQTDLLGVYPHAARATRGLAA